ncbi:trace amine-associated receptor 7d-like [Paramuricea clavata]|uniref:Trace amine-associated receptor 7d-like n=1 Tax=Paramuricea clavata TaxID=317549 RepID=A0A6S7GPF3_PARCT|nr:trace amine-associated receptor 7d-like [Paramuricea clavata]
MENNMSAALIFSNVKVNNGSYFETFTEEALIIITTITAILLLLAIPANILVLLAYLKTSSALKKPANYLLVNLTISELLLALVVIPLQLLVHIKPSLISDGGALCMLVGILTYPFYTAVIITMICVSVDRYYAIRAPLSYKFKISGNRIAYMITYTWFHAGAFVFGFGFSLGIGFNPQMGVCGILWDNNMTVSGVGAITHIVLPFFLLLGLNINLVVSLKRQNRIAVNSLDYRQNQIWKARQAQERRITFLVFWIISTYLLCWLPYLVTRGLWVMLSQPTSALTSTIATISLQLSVLIDPSLNLVFRKDLRATIERLIRRRRNESITIPTGGLNLGFTRVSEYTRHNTRIFVRPKSENVDD